jgi:hypothetical protein
MSCSKDEDFDYSAERLYTFGAYTTSCCDNDADGFRSLVDVRLDIRSNRSIPVFGKVYYKPEGISAKLYQLHTTTEVFLVNYESQYFSLTNEHSLNLPHGRYDLMIELYRASDSTLAISLNGSDNEMALPQLQAVPIELEGEDGG